MVANTAFAHAVGVKPVADFHVSLVEIARVDGDIVERLVVRERTEDGVSLCREFLYFLVELVLFELVLGIPDVLLGDCVGIGGLGELAGLTEQSERLLVDAWVENRVELIRVVWWKENSFSASVSLTFGERLSRN